MDEERIWDLINDAHGRMSPAQKRVWSLVQILPKRWSNTAYGDDNCWVVAIAGRKAVWFNPYEHGFDYTPYRAYGDIGFASGNQLSLENAIQHIVNEIQFGHQTVPHVSGPVAGEFKP